MLLRQLADPGHQRVPGQVAVLMLHMQPVFFTVASPIGQALAGLELLGMGRVGRHLDQPGYTDHRPHFYPPVRFLPHRFLDALGVTELVTLQD
jgi:hypothetical protein